MRYNEPPTTSEMEEITEIRVVRHYYARRFVPAIRVDGRVYYEKSLDVDRFETERARDSWVHERDNRFAVPATDPHVRKLNRARRNRIKPIPTDFLFRDH